MDDPTLPLESLQRYVRRGTEKAALRKGTAAGRHPGAVQTDLSRYLVQGIDAAEAGVSQTGAFETMSPLQKPSSWRAWPNLYCPFL